MARHAGPATFFVTSSSFSPSTETPSTFSITSPACTPALNAGLPSMGLITSARPSSVWSSWMPTPS